MIRRLHRKFKIFYLLKNAIANIFCCVFLLNWPNKWSAIIGERINRIFYSIDIKGKKFQLHSHTHILYKGAKEFFKEEPETIQWIEGIPSDGIFYDVGANFGSYSILASNYCQKVYAFEPMAINYSILIQNLIANSLDNKVLAYCVAVNNQFSFDTLRLRSALAGSVSHTFATNKDICHQEYSPIFNQRTLGISLDDLVYKYHFECPTYLKIDIDGNEHLVIKGMERLLKDLRLLSILIEVNKDLKPDQELILCIQESGFELTEVGKETIHKGMRVGNLIFFRK